MNPFDSPTYDDTNNDDDTTHDEMRFDRLVDGELSDAERRRMLASLDDEPGGWRRCAMAFLEAQAWRESLPDVRQDADVLGVDEQCGESARQFRNPRPTAKETATQETAALAVLRPGSERSRLLGLALAMAACFLVAFFLGTEFRQRFLSGPLPPPRLTQKPNPDSTEFPSAEFPNAEFPSAEFPSAETPRELEDPSPPPQVMPWGEATFVMDDREGREVDVPVFDLDADARQLLLESSTAALDDLRHQLQRRGFDVRQKVRWSPVEIGDDQQIFVPFGDFEISLISSRAIQ